MDTFKSYLVRSIKSTLIFLATSLKYIFPQKLVVEQVTLHLNNIDTPITIAQISDIHYDDPPFRVGDAFLAEVIKRVNGLNPDIIVITGDLVQRNPEPIHKLIENHLLNLKAKHGIYAILGNHDYKVVHGPEMIMNALENSPIRLLHNETVYPMGRGPNKLQLVGLGDYGRKRVSFLIDKVRKDLEEPDRARVVLSHNPDSAMELREFDIDLQLSGHTHGGQVCFPNGSPVIPVLDKVLLWIPKGILSFISYPRKVVKNWEYSRGLHQLKGSSHPNPQQHNQGEEIEEHNELLNNNNNTNSNQKSMYLYVNRGLATHPPLRLFCDPEITLFHLIPTHNNNSSE